MDRQNASTSRSGRLKDGAATGPTISEAGEFDTPHAFVPLAVKPKVACRMLSCGVTRLYELLSAGELQSYLDGRSRLITVESIRVYVARKVAQTKAAPPPVAA